MDLIATSAHSVGLAAVLTAGFLVAAGAVTSRMSRRRVASEPEPSVPDDRQVGLGLAGAPRSGERVIVAGVLRVDGSCCNRLEDAHPVAASGYLRRGGETTDVWCARAAELRVEVGAYSFAIDGTVHVEIGSEEHYPGCPQEQLRARVRERIDAAERVRLPHRSDIPKHGVFRSVKPNDIVMVVGVAERTAMGASRGEQAPASYRSGGGGWRLRPDDSGAVTICCRRRPTIRGALGALQIYATALVT